MNPIQIKNPQTKTQDKLRIAFVADTLHGWIGGGVVSGRQMVKKLRADHEVIVVGADEEASEGAHQAPFQLPFRAMREMNFVMARPDRAALANTFRNVDVVHLHFPFWLSFAALAEARRAGKPVVAAFHVQPENALFNVGLHSDWANRQVYKLWVDRLYNRADAVLCPTPFAERKLRAHGLRTPAYVISNGVAPDVGSVTRQPSGSKDGMFTLLMASRFAAEKRQDLVIEAVRRSRYRDRIHLVLAGAGPLEDKLRAQVADLPGGGEVGFLSRQRLLELYASADLFIHASEVELEGMAVLEAMGAGLPALVAEGSETAASELTVDDRFRFPAGDVNTLAARIDAWLDAPEALAAAGPLVRARARTFDFGESVDHLVGVYRTVIAQSIAQSSLAVPQAG